VGHDLYREVRDYAPRDLSQGELTVAWIIADDANDHTRRSWIANELLCHYARMGPTGVRAALQRLAGRGLEFRMPKGTGKDGRPVFAAKGSSVDYYVPTVADMLAIADTSVSPFPVDNHSPSRHGGVAFLVAKATRESPKATREPPKGDTDVSPLSSGVVISPHIPNGPDLTGPVESSPAASHQDPDFLQKPRRHMTELERQAWTAIGHSPPPGRQQPPISPPETGRHPT
jgi:hypothetical protein